MADPNSQNHNSSENNSPNQEEYPFIKETIKKRPSENRKLLRRIFAAVVCGVILCAFFYILINFIASDMEKKSLSNMEQVRYIGIEAVTISDEQSEDKELPQGLYINSVDDNSPAMDAGVQTGDILHTIDGTEVDEVEEYESVLQQLTVGQKYKIKIYRQDPSGEYKDVVLKITVGTEEIE